MNPASSVCSMSLPIRQTGGLRESCIIISCKNEGKSDSQCSVGQCLQRWPRSAAPNFVDGWAFSQLKHFYPLLWDDGRQHPPERGTRDPTFPYSSSTRLSYIHTHTSRCHLLERPYFHFGRAARETSLAVLTFAPAPRGPYRFVIRSGGLWGFVC